MKKYSRFECIDDACNCIAMLIYKKPYDECNWAEKENIQAKNNNPYWIEENREELLKFSALV